MDIIKTVTSISVKTMAVIACAMPMIAPANTDCYGDFEIDREAKTEAEIEAEFFDNMQSAITLSTDCSQDQPQNPPEPESAQNNTQQGQPAGQSGQRGSAGQQSGQPGQSAQQGGSADQQAQQQDQSAQQGQPGEAGEQQAQNQQPDGDSAAGRQSGQPSANKPGDGGGSSAPNPTTAAIPAANIRGTLPLPPSMQSSQQTKVAEVTTQNSRPPGTDTPPPLSSGAGNRPVKPGNNNDIIAQQILRDAEAETDPELKAKLMAEYERMRGK